MSSWGGVLDFITGGDLRKEEQKRVQAPEVKVCADLIGCNDSRLYTAQQNVLLHSSEDDFFHYYLISTSQSSEIYNVSNFYMGIPEQIFSLKYIKLLYADSRFAPALRITSISYLGYMKKSRFREELF